MVSGQRIHGGVEGSPDARVLDNQLVRLLVHRHADLERARLEVHALDGGQGGKPGENVGEFFPEILSTISPGPGQLSGELANLLEHHVRTDAKIEESQIMSLPVRAHEQKSKAAQDYDKLAAWFVKEVL